MRALKRKVAFQTLGCKLNFTETSMISRSLDPDYFEKVSIKERADIYIINTCSVTDSADKKCRQQIRKTVREAPDNAYIVVVGCYAQLRPDEVKSIKGVDLVLGANEKFNLHNYLEGIEKSDHQEILTCTDSHSDMFISAYSLDDRTRSFLKVQDGCDYMCSYCTVPLARGRSRNQSIADSVEQARQIVESGVREIVITGVNIGDFGKTTGESFYDLLYSLAGIDGIFRYRISSIEPNLLTDDIIKLVASGDKIAPHFHIPLQSGSNKILAKMRRRYVREVFSDRVSKIRSLIPDASVGADIIVGFPGETDDDFEETYEFLEGLDLSYLHSFSYSPRPGTDAFKLPERVDNKSIATRSNRLQRLSGRKKLEFSRKCTGNSYRVIWEKGSNEEFLFGFTDNYLRTKTLTGNAKPGDISRVKLQETDENVIFNVKFL